MVGSAGFVAPLDENRVEIAYSTPLEHQGRGYATRTAAALVVIAQAAAPGIEVYAKTLPEHGPSPAILTRFPGFRRIGTAIDHEIIRRGLRLPI